ncbi:MAG: acyl-CoA dehydrogenase family protein [Acidimicrobiia bacterium]
MDFTPTADQELLCATARTLLANECPPSVVRAHIDDPSASDALSAHLREFAGLAGGPATDLCLFVDETGYAAVPGPFFATTVLFTPLLGALDHELAPAALHGEITGTVAVAGNDGIWRPNDELVKTFVPEADRIDYVAVVTGAPAVALVEASALPIRRVEMLDASRRMFEVDTSSLAASGTPIAPDECDAWLALATTALAAEIVGTARRLFDMTLAYAKERYQFDVPIGSFQAIQHKLADMSLDIERAASAVQYAAMALVAGDAERFRAAHVAKAAAGTAAMRAVKDSIQIHGGIGYTWEHDLHLFLRRAVASEHWMGASDWHHDRLAEFLLGQSGTALTS